MSRMPLLGGVLALLLAAGATTLALKFTKPVVAQQHTDAAVPIDPAILIEHLQNIRGEIALP
jgi:hypothetical protein